MTLAQTDFATLSYDRVPRQQLGRIMAVWMVGFVGSRPLVATLGGSLADLCSVDAALEGIADRAGRRVLLPASGAAAAGTGPMTEPGGKRRSQPADGDVLGALPVLSLIRTNSRTLPFRTAWMICSCPARMSWDDWISCTYRDR